MGAIVGRTRRPGYDRLLATVRRSELGMVLSLKASRLAPNGRKWHIGHLNPRAYSYLRSAPVSVASQGVSASCKPSLINCLREFSVMSPGSTWMPKTR